MTDSTGPMKPKLWHCHDARSLRPLWTLEEMGIDYDLKVMEFPPRYQEPGYLDLNVLGTVPYFVHGKTRMTESTAICHYLVDRFGHDTLRVDTDDPEYGSFLNWLYHSDATLTFPQTIVLRYGTFEKPERRLPQAVEDYSKWFLARLQLVENRLADHAFLCADRLTIADIAVGYALYLGRLLGLDQHYAKPVADYLDRLISRQGFKRARARSTPEDN